MDFSLTFQGDQSVKRLFESCGVPHVDEELTRDRRLLMRSAVWKGSLYEHMQEFIAALHRQESKNS